MNLNEVFILQWEGSPTRWDSICAFYRLTLLCLELLSMSWCWVSSWASLVTSMDDIISSALPSNLFDGTWKGEPSWLVASPSLCGWRFAACCCEDWWYTLTSLVGAVFVDRWSTPLSQEGRQLFFPHTFKRLPHLLSDPEHQDEWGAKNSVFSLKLTDGLAPDGHAYSRLSVVSILAQHWIPFLKKRRLQMW